MRRRAIAVLFAALTLGAVSCNGPLSGGGHVTLQGAGATFPAPLYRKWFAEYQAAHPEVKIFYQSMGSGGGVELFSEGKVDFGASDAAMTDEQIGKVTSGGVQLLPLTAGNVVLAYNLPGISELKLSREAYLGIFQGKIKSWDDPKIAEPNGWATPPKLKITPVRRLGASGTTFVFTQHLTAVGKALGEEWKPGTGLTVNWPEEVKGEKGSDGVAAFIQSTPGAIGYLEFGYALQSKLATAALQNQAKEYVKPSVESGQAALADVQLPENLREWVTDPKGKDAYPIVTFTWLLVHKTYDSSKRAAALKDLCKYALTDGQKECAALGYIPLPAKVAERVIQAVDKIGS
jgi:phosphate transport system substrate-binding protein